MMGWKALPAAVLFTRFALPPLAQRVGTTMGRDASIGPSLTADLTLENPR